MPQSSVFVFDMTLNKTTAQHNELNFQTSLYSHSSNIEYLQLLNENWLMT